MQENSIDFFTPAIKTSQFHKNFKQMLEGPNAQNLQLGFNNWSKGFVDRDNKVVKEFQSSYNSTFWEIYLHALFTKLGLNPSYQYPSPDYLLNYNNKQIIVEAVISNNAKYARPEYSAQFPIDLIIKKALLFNSNAALRYTNSIYTKYQKYINQYSKLEHVKNKPFIIALESFSQPVFFLEYDRAILPTLYGLYVDELNEYNGEIIYNVGVPVKKMKALAKNNCSEIPLGLFTNNKMKEVSAIIFSCTATYSKLIALSPKGKEEIFFNYVITDEYEKPYYSGPISYDNYKEKIQDGICIFHNPFASYPLPDGIFDEIGINHYTYDPNRDQFYRKTNKYFLVTRMAHIINFNKIKQKSSSSKTLKKRINKQKSKKRKLNRKRNSGK